MRNISTDSSERNMEAANQDLETKLMQLQITREKNLIYSCKSERNRIKRHRDALNTVVSLTKTVKGKVEKLLVRFSSPSPCGVRS